MKNRIDYDTPTGIRPPLLMRAWTSGTISPAPAANRSPGGPVVRRLIIPASWSVTCLLWLFEQRIPAS